MVLLVDGTQMGNSQSNDIQLIKESVTGYKAFLADFSCRGFKYEVGQTYEIPAGQQIKLGQWGFHFCRIPDDCKNYYPINANTRYAKIEAWDSMHTVNNSVCPKIRIIEELTLHQFTHLTGIFTTTNRTIHLTNGQLHQEQLRPRTGTFITTDRIIHLKNGKLHRENDLPAVEYPNGDLEYWINGERHREGDLPAVIKVNGDQYWYKNNQLHRMNGPAEKLADGTERWYENNQLHRMGGAAVIHKNGSYEYFFRGQRHNPNGPAVRINEVFGGKLNLWFIHGQEYQRDHTNYEYAHSDLIWIKGKCYRKSLCDDDMWDDDDWW